MSLFIVCYSELVLYYLLFMVVTIYCTNINEFLSDDIAIFTIAIFHYLILLYFCVIVSDKQSLSMSATRSIFQSCRSFVAQFCHGLASCRVAKFKMLYPVISVLSARFPFQVFRFFFC